MVYDTYSSFDNLGFDKKKLLLDDQFSSFVYSVYHIEIEETKWLGGVERSIILLNYGAYWLREIHPPVFKKVT
jgi:hypothetical protein